MLTESRAVTACSPALVRDKGAVRPDIVLLTNGVDVGSYRGPLERPHDLATGPVALYVGTLHADRLDVDLCARTAQDLVRAGARLVLLGPDALQAEERTRLVRAGAELMGPRPHGQVPAYARSADVLVVPHVVDRFTDSLDPIKLYEYRAARRPVVATPVAGFREAGDPLVRAVPAESFPAVVVHTATSPGTSGEEAEEIPSGLPTWDSQAALMREVLGGLMRPPAARPR
nr:glycosyltransferase [Isoptericola halotolerans]